MVQKALILSAGQGKRLLPLTELRAKCLLSFSGRTLLEWQIESLVDNGIRDITVVTGFGAEAVETVSQTYAGSGIRVDTLFNPFFEVAENIGSCFIARALMSADEFVLLNGDTLFHPELFERAMAQAKGPITVTVDKKDRYDDDDMKVHCDGDRLLKIGKHLTAMESEAESIGMLFFSAEGGKMFASAIEKSLRDPRGLKRWYLSIIDGLAQEHDVRVASIHGMEWCEVDYPRDLAAARNLAERMRREQLLGKTRSVLPRRSGKAV